MQQGYIVLHNYPSLSLIQVTYIIINSHTKIDIFHTYVQCCFKLMAQPYFELYSNLLNLACKRNVDLKKTRFNFAKQYNIENFISLSKQQYM